MSSTPSQTPDQDGPGQGRRRGTRELARTGGMVLLAVLVTLFAVLNLNEVEVNWIFGSGRAPLIIVIVISLLIGIVLSYSADRIVRRRR